MAREFREVLAEQLETIDRILAQRELAVSQRPLEAAYIFATECMFVDGEPVKDPFEERWFGDVVKWTQQWYVTRYGARRVQAEEHTVPGLMLIFNTPFKLAIPITVTEPGDLPDITCVMFPTDVLPNERVLDWIVDAPNLAQLGPEATIALEEDVRAVARCTRSLEMNLSTADLEHPVARQMAANVTTHFAKAVDGIVALKDHRMSAAIWELFLAVEMTAKTVLYQISGAAPRTHSLGKLFDRLEAQGVAPRPMHLLNGFPSESDAIRHRYGEGTAPSLAEATGVYRHALQLAERVSQSLRRTLEFSEGRFWIRKLPWARKHD
jgi:HEPN domain-containing protein